MSYIPIDDQHINLTDPRNDMVEAHLHLVPYLLEPHPVTLFASDVGADGC
jgi:hypothetical protein